VSGLTPALSGVRPASPPPPLAAAELVVLDTRLVVVGAEPVLDVGADVVVLACLALDVRLVIAARASDAPTRLDVRLVVASPWPASSRPSSWWPSPSR
jgi:hypothetical protein